MRGQVDDSVISAGSVFEEDMGSSLPYVEIVTRAEYRYMGVLIDERILGMQLELFFELFPVCLVIIFFIFSQTSQRRA